MRNRLHIILLAALLAVWTPAFSQNKKKLESDRARLQKDIELLNRKLAENSKSSEKALSTLTLVRSKIAKREALISRCDQSLRMLDDSIASCEGEIKLLQARYDTLSKYYARLVNASYKNRDGRMWYMYVLSSESIGQAYRRLGYFRSLSGQMNRQAQKIAEASATLEAEKLRLSALRAEADSLRRGVVQERSRLRDEEAEAARISSRLKSDRKTYQKQLQEKNRQIEALNKKIAKLVSGAGKASAKSTSKGKSVTTAVDTKLSNEFASNKGRLPWPVDGVVTERFGKHFHPIYENVQLPQNNGVTLTVKRGASAHAVFNGTVTQVFVLPGYNQCLLVSHGAYYTLYTKLKTVTVKSGDKVTTGQVLGVVDTIGGEDLFHFELWKDSNPQNPEDWLR